MATSGVQPQEGGQCAHKRASDHWSATTTALFSGLFVVVALLVMLFELDPSLHPSPTLPFGADAGRVTNGQILLGLMISCGFGATGVLAWAAVRRFKWAQKRLVQRMICGLLVLAVLASGLSYFYLRPGASSAHYAHRYDMFHYLLAVRYYEELDYPDLYVCVLDVIPGEIIPDDSPVRDLRTYQMDTAGKLRAAALCPRENFTDSRWKRFAHDLMVFTSTPGGDEILRRAVQDRGYNGTPFHATLSGYVADRIPLTVATLNLLPLLDVGMICLMLWAVSAAFSWKIALLFALSVFAMAADRWSFIGGSWMRYAWLATLTMGIVALKRQRFGRAGVWLALASLLNVFPVLFVSGVLVRGAAVCLRERRIVSRYRNFVLTGLLTGMVGLAVGLLPARHFDNYTSWITKMSIHNAERFQGAGTGLKFIFVYRGANTEQADNVPESVRRELFHQNQIAFWPLAAALVALAVAFAARTQDDVEAAVILGFTLFFCLFGTVGYYFACASLLVLALHSRASRAGGAILLGLWFVTNLLANWSLYETGYLRFMYNTVLSLGWTLWLVVLLIWLAAEEGLVARLGRIFAAPAPAPPGHGDRREAL